MTERARGGPCPGRLSGRIAFVSGGLSGIGRACLERFAAEGARVGFCDLVPEDHPDVRALLGELGTDAAYIRADVTSEADWHAVRAFLEARFGPALHILVNNAGTDLTGPLSDLPLTDWERLLGVNATSVYLGTRTLLPLLEAGGAECTGGSSIINMSSIMGLVGQEESAAYSASKGAVRIFTKSVAVEFAKKAMPVRVNSLHPGCIETPLLERGMARWVDSGFAADRDQLAGALAAKAPMGRLGKAEEIAAGAAFLASADAAYMTGAELVIDGGWTAQ